MMKGSGKSSLESPGLSDLLILATSAHLFVGIVTHTLWLLRGYLPLFHYYFGYEDPLFLVFCTALEFSWAYFAWKQFSPGQLLRPAWLFLMISALCHLVGMSFSHILCTRSYISPLYVLDASWQKSVTPILFPLGMFIAGAPHMVMLAGGLLLALRQYRKFGTLGKLEGIDWFILGIAVAFTLHVGYVLVRLRLGTNLAPHLLEALNWANDPLLCVTLFLALFLRRSVVQMGWGYVSKCWGAYVVAIFGTSLCGMGKWAADFNILPHPESAVLWYIWPVIYTAYALGPIYQVEAARIAEARLRNASPSP